MTQEFKGTKKAFLEVHLAYKDFVTSCSIMKEAIIKHFDFDEDLNSYIDQLTVDFNPADGVILIDEYANNFSVDSIINLINQKGKISYDDLQSCGI